MSNITLDSALYYASRGWQVFPITPGQKNPPLVKWADESTCDHEKIKAWWTKTPNANIGIACGRNSGIVVLDIDRDHGGDDSLFDLVTEYGQLPETIESITGSGGRHVIFAHPGIEIRNSAGKVGPGIDIRGDGGYIVAPPSLHPNKKHYEWEPSCKPSKTQLAKMPAWLIELAKEPDAKSTNGHKPAEPVGEKIKDGARNQTLTSLGGTMRRRGMDSEAIYAALSVENNTKCSPPLPDDEVLTIAQSVSRYEPTAPPNFDNGSKRIEIREPLNAYQGVSAFIDLLGNLEGRSISTYIPPIDEAVGGIERQTLSILAARPSMGKTTLAWQIARNVAASKLKVLFFSLEMSTASLWAKAACGACGIRWRDVRAQRVTETELDKIIRKATELMELYGENLLVDDGMNTSESILLSVDKYRPDLLIVDHLRLIADRNDDETKRLGIVSQRLKDIAKDYNCASLCLAQLNRNVESKENKKPQLSDLRDSGQIEENADLVMMMYRADYYDPPDKPALISKTEVLIRKFRDDINNQNAKLYFAPKYQWFGDEEFADRINKAGVQRNMDVEIPMVQYAI